MKLRGALAGLGVLVLAGCSGPAASQPSATSAAATSSAAIPTVSTAAAWSAEAVTACRTFVNAVPNMSLIESQIAQYKPVMTDQERSLAATGWGLGTAGMVLPGNLGINAEPEVYQAMKGVAIALDTKVVNRDYSPNTEYARINTEAFSKAIEVCTDVGVIK